MSGVIYLITNTANGKRYVGKAGCTEDTKLRRLRRRWLEHVTAAKRGKGHILASAIRKYGPSLFTIDDIAYFDNRDLWSDAEARFIHEYKTFVPHGYNLTTGGDGTPGFTHTEATKRKIRSTLNGHPCSGDTRARMSAALRGKPSHMLGKTHTQDTKDTIRQIVTRLNQGRPTAKGNSSPYAGVFWAKDIKRWRAQITVNKRTISLGCFGAEILAALAYDQAALLYYGSGAYTNMKGIKQ